MKLIILLIILLLFGCNAKHNNKEIEEMIANNIRIVNLKDGTKCAVFKNSGSISCNWRNE